MILWQLSRTWWGRRRPFWGGLLTILAGVEIIATTKMTLHGATISVGLTGFQSLLIPFVLVVCGLLAWFTPAQRMFYGLVAVFVAIYSLLAVNLGGWFVGTLLGVVGGGLIFAWNPDEPSGDAAAPGEPEPGDDGDQQADMDGLLDGPMTDTPPPAVNPLRDGVPGPRQPSGDETVADERRGGPRHAAMVITVATLAATALGLVVTQQPASAADCKPAATSDRPVRDFLSGVFDTIGDLLGVEDTATPSPSPSPEPCPTQEPSPDPTGGTKPTAKPKPTLNRPAPSAKPAQPNKKPVKTLRAARNQKPVAECPSRMTGSRVSMEGLTFDGIVELPTKRGTIRTLRFSMTKSVTRDFMLVPCAVGGWTSQITTPALTVADRGDERVYFYTSRFRGTALGVLPVDYTPDEPPLLTPPLVFFTDPIIDLVFVDAPSLTAPDMLIKTIKA